MAANIVPPSSRLARFVEEIRTIAPPPERVVEVARLPDGRTNIVFRELADGRGEVWVAGPNTRAHFKSKKGVARTVILQLRPGYSVPLLGVATSELTNRVVSLEDLWGNEARALCDELATSKTTDVMSRLERELSHRASRAPETTSAQVARRAVSLLEAGEVRVEGVAERLGVTGRHLRRTFIENIGIGPKEFARTLRLQRAVRMARTSSDWARIAADAGYYDQAHLIGDFRELIGLTPGAWAARVRPVSVAEPLFAV